MLFIGIVLVFLLYAVLYLVWDAADISLHGTEGVLRSLTNALLRPENDVFFILRSLLVLALLYVIADHFYSGARRAMKKKKQEPSTVTSSFQETNEHVYRED